MKTHARRVDTRRSKADSARGWVTRVALPLVLAVVVAVAPAGARAQDGAGRQRAERSTLAARLQSLETELAEGRTREKNRPGVKLEIATLRSRLENGDFRIGDRFVYTIVGDSIKSDSASVRDGFLVSIGSIPEVSVRGVLRSELTERLNAHAARFLRNTTVRAFVLTRVSVLGAIGKPGFYYLAPDRPLSEAVSIAGGVLSSGGAGTEGNLKELEVRRNGDVLIDRKASRTALRDGLTLEQLDVQSGDEVRVPAVVHRRFSPSQLLQLGFVISSAMFGVLQFLQWYYRDK